MKNVSRVWVRSQKGSAMILIMALSLASFLSLSFVQYGIYQFKQIAQKSVQDERSSIALNSFFEYTLVGIKQAWCFSSTWQKEASTDCNLTHPRNVSRMFINPTIEDAIRFSMLLNPSNPGFSPNLAHYNDPIKLREFQQDVFLQSIAPGHPLLSIVQPLLGLDYTHIRFQVRLIESANNPVAGDARLLEIDIQLLPRDPKYENQIRGQVMILPRQVNQYALILPNNLILDSASSEFLVDSQQRGNSQIAKFGSWPLRNGTPSPGLRFESPVFVNGDVVVPRAGVSAVAFLDKVTLGGGVLRFADGEPFRPSSAGGVGSRYFSEIENFGGLFNGVELDPGRDRGLDVLYDILSGNPAPQQSICQVRFAARSDLTLTRNSELLKFVNPSTVAAQRPLVHFNLGSVNVFTPQSRGSGQAVQIFPSGASPILLSAQERHYAAGSVVSGATGGTEEVIGRVVVSFRGRRDGAASVAELTENHVVFFVSAGDSDLIISDLANPSARLNLQFRRAVVNGRRQPNEVQMEAWFENPTLFWNRHPVNLSGVDYNSQVRVDFEAFDVAYFHGQSIRTFRQRPTAPYPDNVNLADAAHLYMGSAKRASVLWGRPDAASGFNFRFSDSSAQTVPAMAKWAYWSTCEDFSKTGCAAQGAGIQPPQTWGFLARAVGHPLNTGNNEALLRMEDDHLPVTPRLPNNPDYPFDWANYDSLCGIDAPAAPPAVVGPAQAFNYIRWYEDLSAAAKASWGFTEGAAGQSATVGYLDGTVELTEFDSSLDLAASPPVFPVFNVRARVRDCVVRSSANFVAGYFVCDRFRIDARTTPLRIVGTVITGQLSVDPTAIVQGIRWSTVFSAAAPAELMQARILDTDPNWSGIGTPPLRCDQITTPSWIPFPSAPSVNRLKNCSPHLLSKKADPFTWTSVSPDCAAVNGAAPECKRQPVNFIIKELSRWTE